MEEDDNRKEIDAFEKLTNQLTLTKSKFRHPGRLLETPFFLLPLTDNQAEPPNKGHIKLE